MIGLANSQGQKLYTFDKANISLAETLPLDNDVRQEIYQAVQVGNTVTIHESPITVNGWSGYGYVKIDPETGSGAYKISGGANGGAWSQIFASIGGFFDGQSKFKDHWFNPGNSPLYSRLAKMFGTASFAISIIDTVLNPDLTTGQKVGQIVVNTAAFIGSYALSSYLVSSLGAGLVVGGPVIMLSLLLVTLAILQSILVSLIIESYLTKRNHKDNKKGLFT